MVWYGMIWYCIVLYILPLNFGEGTAWRKVRDRDVWHQVVRTATYTPLRFTNKEGVTLLYCIVL